MKIITDSNQCIIASVPPGEVFMKDSNYYMRVNPLPCMPNTTLYVVDLENGLLEPMEDYTKVELLPDAGLQLYPPKGRKG